MKQKTKKVVCMAVIGALAFTSAIGDNVTSQAAAKTKKIVMNKKKVTLNVGKTFKLKVKKVTPAKASKAVNYKSNKKKVATVSKKGVITGKSAGKATITVTSKKNKKAKAKVTVTVKKGTPNTPTPVPSGTPAASVAPTSPATATPPANQPAASAPATNVPTAAATPKKTNTPSTPKPATAAPTEEPWDGIDENEYEFNVQEQLWVNDWYEREDNEDGSVTLTRTMGDASWQVGEFGFVIPRDVVGNRHKLTKIIIEYKDADLAPYTDDDGNEKTCGYVFHYGDTDRVEWFEEANEVPHNNQIVFNGNGEAVFEADANEQNFSTVRIYDGKIGGKITIVGVRLEKAELPGETTKPGIDTPNVETPNGEASGTETPTTPIKEYKVDIQKELWLNDYCERVDNEDIC